MEVLLLIIYCYADKPQWVEIIGMLREDSFKPRWLPLKAISYFHKAPIRFMSQVAYRYGDTASFKFLNQRLWIIRQPELAATLVKNSDLAKSPLIFKQLYPVTGRQGLVQLDNSSWQLRIPPIKAQFSIQGLNDFLPVIINNIETVLQQLNNGPINIYPLIMKMTMNNILAMLGIEGRSDITAIINDMLVLNKLCGNRMRQLVRWPLFLPVQSHRTINKRAYALRIKLNRLLQTSSLRANSPLHQLQQYWSSSECIDHLSTFLFAGFETTSSSIITALYYLAQDPELQNAIREEGVYTGKLSVQLMRQWSWTHALYCETLRMYPPAYMLARQPTIDIHHDNMIFKSNDLIVVNIHGIHRHEHYWCTPRSFDVRRHLNSSPFANKAFMPFGLGKRICTGHHLAMTESMLTLSLICQRFQLTTPNIIKPMMNTEITLHPRSQIWLNCEPC
ncbi:cytochrome P450 [Legionella cincinnatiensis]|uniref:Cytochrome P450 n=1 Tax=Legionella cincinnatiensis TaxID=28085 RepID=A0A378IME1_9GAMM|nr:cytochrome P450 [Legionella cincinnatiensis]KTC85302.1 cytochrome P450 [Legionella cincinnatiensis]STX36336.1 putative unspecific monooxygenase [Legionella cincinnatiensis]